MLSVLLVPSLVIFTPPGEGRCLSQVKDLPRVPWLVATEPCDPGVAWLLWKRTYRSGRRTAVGGSSMTQQRKNEDCVVRQLGFKFRLCYL